MLHFVVGNDPNGNLRQLSVIGNPTGTNGLIITRTPILESDVLFLDKTGGAFGVALQTLYSDPFPAGYIYQLSAIAARWTAGTVGQLYIGVDMGGKRYLAGKNAHPADEILQVQTNLWLRPNDRVFVHGNVTAAGSFLFLNAYYTRSPLPT